MEPIDDGCFESDTLVAEGVIGLDLYMLGLCASSELERTTELPDGRCLLYQAGTVARPRMNSAAKDLIGGAFGDLGR